MTEPISAHLPWRSVTHGIDTIIRDLPDLHEAACKGRGDLWDDCIYIDGVLEKPGPRAARHRAAIDICDQCPVRLECLATRIADTDLGAGIWGGRYFESSAQEKKRERRKLVNRRCPHCLTLFPVIDKRVYCTDTCQQLALRARLATPQERARRRVNAQLPRLDRCQGCGEPLAGTGMKRNCSKRCRKRSSERRISARTAA